MNAARQITPRTRTLLMELADLALSTPSEVADIFIDWSPHCDLLSVRCYLQGWKHHYAADDAEFAQQYYPCDPGRNSLAKGIRELRKMIAGSPKDAEAKKEFERQKLIKCADRLREAAAAL